MSNRTKTVDFKQNKPYNDIKELELRKEYSLLALVPKMGDEDDVCRIFQRITSRLAPVRYI